MLRNLCFFLFFRPSLFKSISNLLSSTLIIRPYFDNEFSLTEFNRGAKHALCVISNALAVGDTDSLQDLVDSQTLVEIKQNMSRYSSQQLSELAVRNPDDVYLMFPYQVGMIMNDTDKGTYKRYVVLNGASYVMLPHLNSTFLPCFRYPGTLCRNHHVFPHF